MAPFGFLGIEIEIHSSSVKSTKREVVILKFRNPAVIILGEVIIVRYDAILDQSGRSNFNIHLSNYTNEYQLAAFLNSYDNGCFALFALHALSVACTCLFENDLLTGCNCSLCLS